MVFSWYDEAANLPLVRDRGTKNQHFIGGQGPLSLEIHRSDENTFC
jgi:hypothetical protein